MPAERIWVGQFVHLVERIDRNRNFDGAMGLVAGFQCVADNPP